MSDGQPQVRGRIWLSSAIPDQVAEFPDPRVIGIAARGRAGVLHVAMAAFARDYQLVVHADPCIVPLLLHLALGYRPFFRGVPRVLVVANAGDNAGIDFARRWGPAAGAAETVPDAADRSGARDQRVAFGVAHPTVRGAFFVGGSRADMSRDGKAALARNLPCFALPGTGPGADELFFGTGLAMCGNSPALQALLRVELSLPVAINECFDVLESSTPRVLAGAR